MLKVKLLNSISPAGLALMPSERYDTSPGTDDPDALLVRSRDLHGRDLPAFLKVIARAAGLVNKDDLLRALDDGVVAVDVTDFPDKALVAHERVIPIPHLGASTPEAEENCAVMAVRQMLDYLESGNIRNSVSFPTCELAVSGSRRLLAANRNVPNMLGQITTILARVL